MIKNGQIASRLFKINIKADFVKHFAVIHPTNGAQSELESLTGFIALSKASSASESTLAIILTQ